MSIAFSNTQGDVTITVNDNTIDQTRYSLTLLGRNVTNYGQHIAQNTIRQLENFASPNQPNPSVKLVGQLWYDKTGEHLRVYRGATDGFQELGFRPVLTGSDPSSNVQNGELYFNTTTSIKNLKIYTGSAWVKVSDQDSANVDAKTITTTFTMPAGGFGTSTTQNIGNISPGRKIISVYVDVDTAFSSYSGNVLPSPSEYKCNATMVRRLFML